MDEAKQVMAAHLGKPNPTGRQLSWAAKATAPWRLPPGWGAGSLPPLPPPPLVQERETEKEAKKEATEGGDAKDHDEKEAEKEAPKVCPRRRGAVPIAASPGGASDASWWVSPPVSPITPP